MAIFLSMFGKKMFVKGKNGKHVFHRMDDIWIHMSQRKAPNGYFMLEKFSLVTLLILTESSSFKC